MARPERIWVPRTLFVSDDGVLDRGPGAGVLVEAPGYPRLALGARRRLADLRHTAWFVERAKLDDALVDRYAIVLPERLLDRDAQPHAHRWLAESRFVCLSGVKWHPVVRDDKLRIHRVAIEERAGVPWLVAEGAGGGKPSWSFAAPVPALEAAARRASGPVASRIVDPVSSVVDRVLDRVSGGVLDEASIVAAWEAADLVEPGYGYRGAEDGSPATIEQVQHGARALEVAFAQIAPRGDSQVEVAAAIAKVLDAPRSDDAPLPPLPVLGEVARVELPEIRLEEDTLGDGVVFAGDRVATLVLPATVRHVVGEVEPWVPEIPPELAKKLATILRERTPPPEWMVFVVVGVLVAIALVSLLLRG